MFQCVAVWCIVALLSCSVLQCVAVCRSVHGSGCDTAHSSIESHINTHTHTRTHTLSLPPPNSLPHPLSLYLSPGDVGIGSSTRHHFNLFLLKRFIKKGGGGVGFSICPHLYFDFSFSKVLVASALVFVFSRRFLNLFFKVWVVSVLVFVLTFMFCFGFGR